MAEPTPDIPQSVEREAYAAPAAFPLHRAMPRLIPGIIFACSLSLLLVAAYLQPDAAGVGTHEQLGLPPCGFLAMTGLPCATCSMTTAFSHAADGNLLASFATQPAGAMLALLTAVTAVVSGYATLMGMSLAPIGRSLNHPRTILAVVILLLVGWAYTITRTLLGM